VMIDEDALLMPSTYFDPPAPRRVLFSPKCVARLGRKAALAHTQLALDALNKNAARLEHRDYDVVWEPVLCLLSGYIEAVQGGAARVIQAAWRRAISDPRFAVCRARLSREWHDMATTMSFAL
jgi:hypothetical protein